MAFLVNGVRKIKVFGLLLTLFSCGILPSIPAAFAADPIRLSLVAQPGASVASPYSYNPETGELNYRAEGNGVGGVIALKAFGAIKGLKPGQVHVYQANVVKGVLPKTMREANVPAPVEKSVVVVHHGHWISIIDPIADEAIVSNIGPVSHVDTNHRGFDNIFKTNDGEFVITFIADAVDVRDDGPNGTARRRLFIVNTRNKTVGWVPLRADQNPRELEVTLTNGYDLTLKGKYTETVVKEWTTNGQKYARNEVVDVEAQMSVSLKTGQVVEFVGGSFMDVAKHKEIQRRNALRGMYEHEAAGEHLVAPGVSSLELEETGNSNDPKAREIAFRVATQQIEAARGIETRVRAGFKRIHGQPDAIDAIVKYFQDHMGAPKFGILAFGGTTGTGKTSAAEALATALFPEAKEPMFTFKFTSGTKKEFLETELFGSKPGYVGSTSPTGLMMWMLKNPEGGVALFDEIDSAEAGVVNTMLSYFDKGEVKIGPALVAELLKSYKDVPESEWPRVLREATNGGTNANVEITLRLTPNHHIILGMNAGAALYNGAGSSNVGGRRLKSEEELRQANKRFNGAVIKSDLRSKGFSDSLLARVSAWVPFKVLMPDDHALVVRDQLDSITELYRTRYRVTFEVSPELRAYLEKETYNPLEGARVVQNSLNQWLGENLNQSIVKQDLVRPGDKVTVMVEKGDAVTPAKLKLVKQGTVISEYVVGNPLPPRPTALLEKARQRLLPTLEKRIVGHREELKQVADTIISQLLKAVNDPTRQGRPVVIYFDSTPGIGKTEIAKGVSEALFEDASGLRTVPMDTIVHEQDFYRVFVQPMVSSVRSNPESLVALLDELPRAGDNSASKLPIQNQLLGVFDEGRLPAIPGETRLVNGVHVPVTEITMLPPATIFLCTGNLAEKALDGRGERMTNRELLASFRLMARHPEKFRRVYGEAFTAALRSRMGEPILLSPLTDAEVEMLRDRFLDQAAGPAKKIGSKITLSDSAKVWFTKNYIPIRGGRWIRWSIEHYIEAPLNAIMASDDTGKYKDAEFEIFFDEKAQAMSVRVIKGGKTVETAPLAQVQRSKMEMHPDARERSAWKTSVHEIGHALVRRALYGPGSVAEINTFGGGEGGWMEKGFDVPTEDGYLTTKRGPYDLAVSLGGHIAEMLYLSNGTANGASSDFENTRKNAQTMLLDGSTLQITPLPVIFNPTTGQADMSEKAKQDLEMKQTVLMEFAGRIAMTVLQNNKDLHLALAKQLFESKDMHLSRDEFEKLVGERLNAPTEKEIEAMIVSDPLTRDVCQSLLLGKNAVTQTAAKRSWIRKILDSFRRKR